MLAALSQGTIAGPNRNLTCRGIELASMRVAVTVAALMCTASAVAYFARPSASAADRTPKIQLDAAVPKQFGPWREELAQTVAVVNPQTQQLLDKLYSQVLSVPMWMPKATA